MKAVARPLDPTQARPGRALSGRLDDVWMTWQQAGWLAFGCLVVTVLTTRLPHDEPMSGWVRGANWSRAGPP